MLVRVTRMTNRTDSQDEGNLRFFVKEFVKAALATTKESLEAIQAAITALAKQMPFGQMCSLRR